MYWFIGPACSDTVEPVAGVSKRFKTIAISYSAQGSSFADRNKFPYFFRTIGETGQFKCVHFSKLILLAKSFLAWVLAKSTMRNQSEQQTANDRVPNKFFSFFSFYLMVILQIRLFDSAPTAWLETNWRFDERWEKILWLCEHGPRLRGE